MSALTSEAREGHNLVSHPCNTQRNTPKTMSDRLKHVGARACARTIRACILYPARAEKVKEEKSESFRWWNAACTRTKVNAAFHKWQEIQNTCIYVVECNAIYCQAAFDRLFYRWCCLKYRLFWPQYSKLNSRESSLRMRACVPRCLISGLRGFCHILSHKDVTLPPDTTS